MLLNILQTLSTTTRSVNSTNGQQSTSAGTNSSNLVNITNTNTTENRYSNDTSIQTSATTTTVNHNSSLFPGDLTDHIVIVDVMNVKKNNEKGKNEDWLFILIVTASSFITTVALIFVMLVFRHKRKNGVWFKG
jgi:ATP-dependent Zn protease